MRSSTCQIGKDGYDREQVFHMVEKGSCMVWSLQQYKGQIVQQKETIVRT